jgi:hypothetical protein
MSMEADGLNNSKFRLLLSGVIWDAHKK